MVNKNELPEYLMDGSKIVGIKLPFGCNIIKDTGKGIIIEFAKRKFLGNIQLQIRNRTRSVINFGLSEAEADMLRLAIEECLKI